MNILTGKDRKNSKYGTTNSAISFAGTKVSFNSVDVGAVNAGEWIDYKYLIDIDNSKAELYTGAYGTAKTDIKLNTTEIIQAAKELNEAPRARTADAESTARQKFFFLI